MAIIRWILGRLILLVDALTSPRGVKRPADQQADLDQLTANLTLYQYKACPFCVKVRRFLKRHSMKIELRDPRLDPRHREELLQQGGQLKVPCLKIVHANGNVEWLYESSDIMSYLQEEYLDASPQQVQYTKP